jgi:cytochrome P450
VVSISSLVSTDLMAQVGLGLIASDGEDHKRQRKQISPGFTTAKIREYSELFFACSHKVYPPGALSCSAFIIVGRWSLVSKL